MKRQSWGDYEAAAERGPLPIIFKVLGALFVVGLAIYGVGYVFGWFDEAATVAQEEFGARAALEKYEWFKDAAAQLEKKQADITVYETRLATLRESYKSVPRQRWPREDREQYNVWSSEVAGVKAGYNTLAAEYNSSMAKFNWRFANAGELPKGADRPLPREFKAYVAE